MAAYCTYYTARPADVPSDSLQRRIARIYGTQSEATTRGTATADESTYIGSISDDADLGWWLTISGAEAGTVTEYLSDALMGSTRKAAIRAAARLHGRDCIELMNAGWLLGSQFSVANAAIWRSLRLPR